MKQRKVVSMIGVLIVMISTVAFITGCQQANNNKDKAVNKAVYVAKVEIEGTSVTYTLTFKADGTWINRAAIGSQDIVTMEGTYTGDPSKDGTIKVTLKKSLNEKGALEAVEGSNEPESITISGGKFSIGEIEYTRR